MQMKEVLVATLRSRMIAVGWAEALREMREAVASAEHEVGRMRGEAARAGEVFLGEIDPCGR